MQLRNWDCGDTACRVVLQSYDIIPVKYYTAIQEHQSYEARLFSNA